jgi:O-antigen ligase
MTQLFTLLAVLTLPFTQALTINLGFPLKAYEFFLSLASLTFFSSLKFKIPPTLKMSLKLLIIFLFVASITTFIKILWPGTEVQTLGLEIRFGPVGDAFSKIIYLILNILGFFLFALLAYKNPKGFIDYWLIGAILSSIYGIYLFFSCLLGWPIFLLPGLDKIPSVENMKILRFGTFGEGNFFGLYLLISSAIAFWAKRIKLSLFLSLSIITTLSTINIIGIFLFWFFVLIKYYLKLPFLKKILTFILILVFSFSLFVFISKNETLQKVIVAKIFLDASESGSSSKEERLNQSLAGLKMFLNNPIIGVGLSQYGYYFEHYDPHKYSIYFEKYFFGKQIANNVYVELLAELGLVGSIPFFLFLFFIFFATRNKNLWELRLTFLIMLLIWVAYPSYSLMFIWAFLGLILGLPSYYPKLKKEDSRNEENLYKWSLHLSEKNRGAKICLGDIN